MVNLKKAKIRRTKNFFKKMQASYSGNNDTLDQDWDEEDLNYKDIIKTNIGGEII